MKVTEHISNVVELGEPRIEVDITVDAHRSDDPQQIAIALAEHTKDGLEEVQEVLEDG